MEKERSGRVGFLIWESELQYGTTMMSEELRSPEGIKLLGVSP